MPLRAVVFDWAGTTVDFGSRAPMASFVEAFARFGVTISIDEARGPMGLPKRDHIKALLNAPEIAARWRAARHTEADDKAIDEVLAVFEPLNVESVGRHATLIPGARDVVNGLRARNVAIGSTTGYTRPIMARLALAAAAQGYVPDCVVCAGDLPAGRPGPMMMWKVFLDLGIETPAEVVKVDDTAPGIAEGRAAGTWTVGVTLSGNGAGLTADDYAAAAPETLAELHRKVGDDLLAAGAHLVIDTVADLPRALSIIEKRMMAGERP